MTTEARIARLDTCLVENELDVYLATQTSDIRYLTGFQKVFDEEQAHAMLVTSSLLTTEPYRALHTDMRYSGAMKTQNNGVLNLLDEERKAHSAFVTEQLEVVGVDRVKSGSLLRIGIEADMPLTLYRSLTKALDEAEIKNYELVELPGFIQRIRAVKDAQEIASIRAAQQISDVAFLFLLELIKPGLTEFEVAVELDFFMRRQGSEGVAFGSIVGSGPNSANPHAVPGNRIIQAGDLIVLDFGARLDDYRSDMTRTVAIGKASERQREIYNTVLDAQLLALSMIRAGISAKEPAEKVNQLFAERGFEALSHGLGHGVGIDIHEAPTMSPTAQAELEVGHVVTVEPGIYIEGSDGVRIEDFGAVTASGFDNFTTSSKELFEL
jgi:Xaa-Pro aminopeptidase